MTQNIRELEQDIEQTRARLDPTIDRLQGKIQDKLTVSGVVDELIGRGRQTRYAAVFDETLAVIKRNPIPVMLIAAGVGWLIHRMATDQEDQLARRYGAREPRSDAVVPVPVGGNPRVYDPDLTPRTSPDLSPRSSVADTLEHPRDLSTRT